MGHSQSQITKDVYTDIDYNLSKDKVISITLHKTQQWIGHTQGSVVTNSVYTHARDNAEIENINIYNKKFN